MSHIATFFLLFFSSLFLFAGPNRTTYQAKIIKPDGYPLEAASVNFKFTILDPAGACILYSETYSAVNMTATGGLISFSLGSGVKTYPVSSPTFADVFSNITPSLSCDVGGPVSYSPSSNDIRKIVMQFHDGNGWQTLPAMNINAVPYAMYADDAQNLGGVSATSYVRYSTIPTCAVSEAVHYNGTSFSCLAVDSGGGVTSGSVITALGYTPADGASVTAVSSYAANVSSTVFSVSSTVTSLANTVAASFASITSSQWLTSGTTVSYNAGNVGIGTSAPVTTEGKVVHIFNDLNDGTVNSNSALIVESSYRNSHLVLVASSTAGSSLYFRNSSVPNQVSQGRISYLHSTNTMALYTSGTQRLTIDSSGRIGIGTATPVTNLSVSGGLRISMESATCAASYAGTLRYNSGLVEYCNGTAWAAFGVAGAGITMFNGSSSGTQSFVTGISGTNFNVTTENGLHTFNIPLAASGSVTAGLLSNADYVAFSNKVNANSASVISALGYTPASATTVATLSSSLTTVSNAVTAAQANINSVSSAVATNTANISAVSSTVASLSSSTAASFAAITSSQWLTSGSTISYNSGYVGVGTVAPTANFHVSGTGQTVSVVESTSDTNGSIIRLLRRRTTGAVVDDDYTGGVKFQGMTSAGTHAVTGAIESYVDATPTANKNPGRLVLSTTNMAGTTLERMRIDSEGNIGIGTTSPAALLHLTAGTASLAPLKLTSGTLLTSPASGAIEYDGFYYYITDGTNTRRAIATVANPGTYDNASVISSSGNITLVPVGSVVVSSTTASTNSTTGALVVQGGLGVAGNIYSSGTIITNSNMQASSFTATSGMIAPIIYGGVNAAGNLQLESTTHASKGNVLIGYGGGNIGMGTNQPLAKLYVDGDGMSPNTPMTGVVAAFDKENSDMGINLFTGPANKASVFFGVSGQASRGAVGYQFNSTNYLDKMQFDVNAQTRMTITGSGSVGVGSGTPSAMMDVVNNSNKSILTLVAQPSQTVDWFRINDSSGTTRSSISPNGGMPQFTLGVTNPVRLTAEYGGTGEVPGGGLFHTTGNLNLINGGANGVKSTLGYFNGSSYFSAWEIANTASGFGNFLLMKSGGNVGVGVSATTAKLHLGSGTTTAAPIKIVSGTLLTTPQAGAIEYDGFNYYITNGANARRTIATDNNTSFTAGNIAASGSLNLTNSANLYLTATASDPGDIIFQESSGTQKGRVWANPSAVGLFLSSGDTVPDISINAAGNVGIGGITNATEALEVSGAIKIPGVGQIGPAYSYGYAMYTTGTNNFIAQMYGSASGVQFTNSAGTNTMNIQDNGDVGIGSIAAISRLTVAANATNANLVTLYNSANNGISGLNTYSSSGTLVGGLGWGNYNSGPSYSDKFFINSSKSMTFITNNSERLGIDTNGLVGIGIVPTTILSVSHSNPTVQIMDAELNPGDGSIEGKVAFGSGGAEWGSIALTRIPGYADDVNDIVFKNSFATGAGGPGNNNERMRIRHNGYVGIGTSTPTNTLDVLGVGLTVTREQTFGTLASFRKAYTAANNEDPYIQFYHQTASGGTFNRYSYIQSGQSHGGLAIQAENGAGSPGNLMLNKSGGSVGVGVNTAASMTAAFNIVGSSGGEVAQYIHNTNPAGYAVIRMNNNWGGYASGTALHAFGSGYGTVGTAYAPSTTTLTGFDSGGLTLHANTGPIRFFTNGNVAANYQMMLSTAGYLGLGTSVPAVKTHIYNQVDGPFTGLAIDNRKIYGAGTGINETARMIFSLSEPTVTNVNDRVMGYIEGGTELENSSANTFMAFGTRAGGPGTENEKMRINSSGYVGIGTSSPSARLNIGGLGAANATALRIDSQDTYYRDIFISEFNTTTYGGILRYNSGSDLLQLVTLENGVEKYGVAVARATGYVGIGLNSAAAYPLDVNGSIRISGAAYRDDGVTTWAVTSDSRLKDVISSYDRGLKEILDIDTVIFKYKKDNPRNLNSTKEFPGVVAQQVQKVIPEAVDMEKDGYFSLNTTPIIWAMLNAIKEVYHQVLAVMKNDQAQDRMIASVQEENQKIKAENEKIKAENALIKAYLCAKDPSAPICK